MTQFITNLAGDKLVEMFFSEVCVSIDYMAVFSFVCKWLESTIYILS